MAATASDHTTALPRNGNSPPWGNSSAAMPTGAAASTASTASRGRLSCSHHAVRARASTTPATGLAGAVAIARTAARTSLVAARRGQCRHRDGQPEGERQPPDRHVDHGAGGEQQARRQCPRPSADQVVEAPGSQDAAGDGDGVRSDQCTEHREQHAVRRRVVTGEPQVVPDRRTGRLDQLDPQQLCRPVATAPAEGDRDGGEHARQGSGHDIDVIGRRVRISRPPCWWPGRCCRAVRPCRRRRR